MPNRPPAPTPGPVAEPQHSDQWDLPISPAQVSAGSTHSGSPPLSFPTALSKLGCLPSAPGPLYLLFSLPGLFCPADVHMARSLPHFSPLLSEAVPKPWVRLCPSPPPQGPLLVPLCGTCHFLAPDDRAKYLLIACHAPLPPRTFRADQGRDCHLFCSLQYFQHPKQHPEHSTDSINIC